MINFKDFGYYTFKFLYVKPNLGYNFSNEKYTLILLSFFNLE